MKIRLGLGKTNMEKIAAWCFGELYDFTNGCGNSFEYVCTDSREADPDTMFVATRGERVDGHDYISSAIEKGCRCILCEYVPTNISGKNVAYVVVENSIDAFADCARGYRAEASLYSVAVTGSVGKTTTKELVASILKNRFNTYCTAGNFNSVIGMPMSLMESGKECERAVFEMGMSDFGEIRRMTHAARPRVAMVVNIGTSHLEYLKTRENIAKAKLEIAEGIESGGYLLLNKDEPLLAHHKGEDYNTLFVSVNDSSADVFAYNIRTDNMCTLFDLRMFGEEFHDLELSIIGKHYVYNAAFASAAAWLVGADGNDIRNGLKAYKAGKMRMNIKKFGNVTVLEDCYNAAPESMRAAIDTLGSFAVNGRKIAVLGDMKELGRDSDEYHRALGGYVAEKDIDMLLTVGESGALIAYGAKDAGMDSNKVLTFADENGKNKLAIYLSEILTSGDAVLFKASRAMKLEEIIESAVGSDKE